MYILVSFAFGGTSNVVLHALTRDLTSVEKLYHELAAKDEYIAPPEDAEDPFHTLLELLEVPDDFLNELGHDVFWGKPHPAVKVLMGNNQQFIGCV